MYLSAYLKGIKHSLVVIMSDIGNRSTKPGVLQSSRRSKRLNYLQFTFQTLFPASRSPHTVVSCLHIHVTSFRSSPGASGKCKWYSLVAVLLLAGERALLHHVVEVFYNLCSFLLFTHRLLKSLDSLN